MIEVVPSILEHDFEEIKRKINLVCGLVKRVQIDICDGIFVPNKTWPYSSGGLIGDKKFKEILQEKDDMPFCAQIGFELDLMVVDAVTDFDIYLMLDPKGIIFHIEAVGDLDKFKTFLENLHSHIKNNLEIGIAINLNTPLEMIFPFIPLVNFVQTMGIEKIGFQGQPFDERVLGNIKTLRSKFPNLKIEVDGGVNLETSPKLVSAGANALAPGSVVFKSSNIEETINIFKHL